LQRHDTHTQMGSAMTPVSDTKKRVWMCVYVIIMSAFPWFTKNESISLARLPVL